MIWVSVLGSNSLRARVRHQRINIYQSIRFVLPSRAEPSPIKKGVPCCLPGLIFHLCIMIKLLLNVICYIYFEFLPIIDYSKLYQIGRYIFFFFTGRKYFHLFFIIFHFSDKLLTSNKTLYSSLTHIKI